MRILAILWVVRTPRTLLISSVSLMVGRQAGRLLDCGGLIVTGTNPGEELYRKPLQQLLKSTCDIYTYIHINTKESYSAPLYTHDPNSQNVCTENILQLCSWHCYTKTFRQSRQCENTSVLCADCLNYCLIYICSKNALLNRIDAGFIAGWKRAWHYAQHIKNLLGLHGTHRHIDSQRTWLPGRCHKAWWPPHALLWSWPSLGSASPQWTPLFSPLSCAAWCSLWSESCGPVVAGSGRKEKRGEGEDYHTVSVYLFSMCHALILYVYELILYVYELILYVY